MEYFDVVDESDKVIGRASRDECHKKGLLHRGVFILVINSEGKILMQKRSMNKDIWPGWWTTSVSGHVDSEESYEVAAKREMNEEIGVSTKIKEIYTFVDRDEGKDFIDHEIDKIFVAQHDGPFKVNKAEADYVTFYSLGDAMKLIKKEKVTPAAIKIFKELQKRPELLKRLGLE